MTVTEYLKGKAQFATSEAISVVLADRQTDPIVDESSLTVKQKELLCADLYVWAECLPISSSGSKVSHGGFSETGESKTYSLLQIRGWVSLGHRIYRKYGDQKYVSQSTITNVSELWQR